jgi:AraC family transcriptional activator of pyochelin receptor
MKDIQTRAIEIREMATVVAHQSPGQGSMEFSAKPMEIYLICLKEGQMRVQASFIPHPIELAGGEAIFLAFPKSDWQAKLIYQPGVEYYTIKLQASTLHKLINPAFEQHQLDSAQKINMRDFMKLIPVNPSLLGCFDQLVNHKLQHPFSIMFEQAKFLEIFSLLMESAFGQHMDACPVMITTAIENKLHQVRRHIVSHIDVVPDPDQLAILYELPRNTLREGYRYFFGKTIHQFHADHKLESAMLMLNSGELLVKEIAFKIGYQNPSHFITAFKKKFGYTPKQYLKREAS